MSDEVNSSKQLTATNDTTASPEFPTMSLKYNNIRLLNDLEANLLDQLKISYATEGTISEDMLESLHFIYKSPLLEVLNAIDKQLADESSGDPLVAKKAFDNPLVVLFKCENDPKRRVFMVKGFTDLSYFLFDALKFCTCQSFKYNVLGRLDYFYCKHIILAKLLIAMDKIVEKEVKDTEMVEMIRQIQ